MKLTMMRSQQLLKRSNKVEKLLSVLYVNKNVKELDVLKDIYITANLILVRKNKDSKK